jgi:hypothetical protein
VHEAFLQSGLSNFLEAIPLVAILVVALFRLDEIIACPKRVKAIKRPFCVCDENGRLLLPDPDGRSWGAAPKARYGTPPVPR